MAAIPVPAAHFLHPKHELKLREEYHLSRSCDLCGEKLTGSGYSCHWRLCDFNLHEECAKYPETLGSFFAHPWHDLTLARTDARRLCHLCREEVPAGDFAYRCAPCGFDVHPRCSRLPQTARSELHPDHALTALPGMGTCAACRELCGVWVYHCGLCDFDLHIECLHGARPSPSTTTTTGGGGSKEKEPSLGDKLVGRHAEAAGGDPGLLQSFFAHPSHDLTLARTDARRLCELCREEVPAGVFAYRCAPCGFDVHPRCSRLPQTARSEELHPEHGLSLTAMPSAGAPCAACREPCSLWVYRCEPCDVDLHIECLHGARSSKGKNGKGWSSAVALAVGFVGGKVIEGFAAGAGENVTDMLFQ